MNYIEEDFFWKLSSKGRLALEQEGLAKFENLPKSGEYFPPRPIWDPWKRGSATFEEYERDYEIAKIAWRKQRVKCIGVHYEWTLIPSKKLVKELLENNKLEIQEEDWSPSRQRTLSELRRWSGAKISLLKAPRKKRKKIEIVECRYCHGTGKRKITRWQ